MVIRISLRLELHIERESTLVSEHLIILQTETVIAHVRTAYNTGFATSFHFA